MNTSPGTSAEIETTSRPPVPEKGNEAAGAKVKTPEAIVDPIGADALSLFKTEVAHAADIIPVLGDDMAFQDLKSDGKSSPQTEIDPKAKEAEDWNIVKRLGGKVSQLTGDDLRGIAAQLDGMTLKQQIFALKKVDGIKDAKLKVTSSNGTTREIPLDDPYPKKIYDGDPYGDLQDAIGEEGAQFNPSEIAAAVSNKLEDMANRKDGVKKKHYEAKPVDADDNPQDKKNALADSPAIATDHSRTATPEPPTVTAQEPAFKPANETTDQPPAQTRSEPATSVASEPGTGLFKKMFGRFSRTTPTAVMHASEIRAASPAEPAPERSDREQPKDTIQGALNQAVRGTMDQPYERPPSDIAADSLYEQLQHASTAPAEPASTRGAFIDAVHGTRTEPVDEGNADSGVIAANALYQKLTEASSAPNEYQEIKRRSRREEAEVLQPAAAPKTAAESVRPTAPALEISSDDPRLAPKIEALKKHGFEGTQAVEIAKNQIREEENLRKNEEQSHAVPDSAAVVRTEPAPSAGNEAKEPPKAPEAKEPLTAEQQTLVDVGKIGTELGKIGLDDDGFNKAVDVLLTQADNPQALQNIRKNLEAVRTDPEAAKAFATKLAEEGAKSAGGEADASIPASAEADSTQKTPEQLQKEQQLKTMAEIGRTIAKEDDPVKQNEILDHVARHPASAGEASRILKAFYENPQAHQQTALAEIQSIEDKIAKVDQDPNLSKEQKEERMGFWRSLLPLVGIAAVGIVTVGTKGLSSSER